MSKYLHWASLFMFFIGSIFIFSPTWSSLIHRWNKMDESYSHGYLVLIISCFFILKQLRLIDFDKVKANYFVVPFLIVSSLIWALAVSAHIEVIHQVLLPIMLAFSFVMVFGFDAGKKFLFPVLYLLIAIPFWDYLVEPLQAITVSINSILLDLAGVTAYIEGFFVTIPSGKFEIAGGCSGLRYVIVALALAILYAYQNYSRWITIGALLLTAISFALLANWLRVFIIIVVGHVTEMESSLIESHDTFGWILFGITLGPFFYLAIRYLDWFEDGLEVSEGTNESTSGTYKPSPYVLAFFATFAIPLFLSLNASDVEVPGLVPDFLGNRLEASAIIINPVFSGADIIQDEVYELDEGLLQVSLRTYGSQKPGKELIYYANTMFSNKWEVIQQSNNNKFSLYYLQNQDSGQKLVAASSYFIGSYQVSNRMYAKILELFKPFMSSKSSSILILASQCEASCKPTKERIDRFISMNREVLVNL